jgi:sporulation protein YlmC with PRC-barrel domain
MKLASLKPDTRNANRGTDRGRKLVRESLKRYGAGRSILIDKSGNIIAGNKTAEGAKAVGLGDVQIVKSDGSKLIAVQRTDLDINDKAARELAIADNRASEVGLEWDPEVLKSLETEDVDIEQFFDERELVQFWAKTGDTEAPEPKIDQAAELQQKWGTELGQLWLIGRHRLLCGDATNEKDHAKVLQGEEVAAVVCDPPYGVGIPYASFDDSVENVRALVGRSREPQAMDHGALHVFILFRCGGKTPTSPKN